MGIKHFGDVGGDPQISNHFTLSQLTVTSQNVNNTPDADAILNLKKLGAVLDMLYDYIGPIQVLSAFRSPEVELALTASGQPTAEAAGGKISFHTVGLGADIVPTTMSLDEFFGKMMAAVGTEEAPGPFWDQMAEIAYKPTQGSIHLAAGVDYRANNVILALNTAGTYAKLTAEEIMDYASPYVERAVAAIEETATAAVTTTKGRTILLAGLGLIAIFIMMKQPKRVRA